MSISKLRVVFIVCNCSLQNDSPTYLNLLMIAKKLTQSENIVKLKLLGVIEWGFEDKKKKRKSVIEENKRIKKRKDFSNQCTVVVKLRSNPSKQINLKIFGNGNVIITGSTCIEECHEALSIFKEGIKELQDNYSIISPENEEEAFTIIQKIMNNSTTDYLKFINRNYFVLLKMFERLDIGIEDCDLRLDLILNRKLCEKYPTANGKIFIPLHKLDLYKIYYETNTLFDKANKKSIIILAKIIQIYNILHEFYPNEVILDKLDKLDNLDIDKIEENTIYKMIKTLYSDSDTSIRLAVIADKEDYKQFYEKRDDFKVEIVNHNTQCITSFQIDRYKLLDVIEKEQINNPDIIVHFEPSGNYPGINLKHNGYKVTFLIFQPGKITVTGGKSEKKINDAYEFLKKLLLENVETIQLKC